jgi:hypothetical protein
MPRGPAVPVKGVWLRRLGDHVIVSIEAEDGRDIEVIREWHDGNFSHNISEHGLRALIDGTGTVNP